ncbi:MAG TPA: hypothetical protein VK787_05380 [Puia sp.]|jgi:hypothetical protein|nr:hypothetical protein [Puia sp.]
MKYFLPLFLLLAFSISLKAQFSYGSIHLTSEKKIKHIQRVPFSKVEVFDNRFDTTNFLVNRNVLKAPEMDSFSMPASKEIRNYIEKIIAPFPKDNRMVYINLKQLRFGNLNNLSRFLFFTAEVYAPENKDVVKIFSFEKKYLVRRGYRATITRALNDFVIKISKNYSNDSINRKTCTIEDLHRNVQSEWAALPIIQQNSYYENGIFTTWKDFRDDKLISCNDFYLQAQADSTYRIRINGESDEYQKSDGQVKNVWAVSYEGKLYIPILGKYFVPLEKKDNTFYFYIPHSLQDMVEIIPHWNFFEFAAMADGGSQIDLSGVNVGGKGSGHGGAHGGGGHGGGHGNVDGRVLLILFGVVVVVVVTVAVIKAIEKNHQRKKEVELISQTYAGENFRNCFIDMGTGDIIYH